MPKRKLNPVYEHQGYLFRYASTLKDGSELLYCSFRKTSVCCLASAKRNNGLITVVRDHYGHDANMGLVKAKLARIDMKKNAKSTTLTPRELLFDAKSTFGAVPVDMAGSLDTLSRMIHRSREKDSDDIKNANLKTPVFTGDMRITNESTDFILFDEICPSSGGRVVAFASEAMVETLANSDLILTDGTFSCVRAPFSQLWIIHGRLGPNATVPLVYVLMCKRTKSDYEYVLEKLKALPQLTLWNPNHFIGDLESAQEKAIKDTFPAITCHFCLFHTIQSWRRKLEKLGLQKNIDFGFFSTISILTALFTGFDMYDFWSLLKNLPFVPTVDVEDTFEKLLELMPATRTTKQKAFIDYLRRYYIGPHPSLPYPPVTWNAVEVSLKHLPRTSNCVEASHRRLDKVVKMTNGRRSIYISDLVITLRNEATQFRFDVQGLNNDPHYMINHKRNIKDVLKDARVLKVLVNKPAPPCVPLKGLEYLKAMRVARKYT
ncbi:hypothetical protein CAEBREN_01400 [Caenorhabditis brenneri]|uniref:MULE transposase domain-containing protein n=1 Tax=Caenorhabditis brenneri TaxID=135651 RepID=G0NJD3_CAEBE|nr:hypothetical protein CAEBREN_01400 [Caenorhabditis brenneri]